MTKNVTKSPPSLKLWYKNLTNKAKVCIPRNQKTSRFYLQMQLEKKTSIPNILRKQNFCLLFVLPQLIESYIKVWLRWLRRAASRLLVHWSMICCCILHKFVWWILLELSWVLASAVSSVETWLTYHYSPLSPIIFGWRTSWIHFSARSLVISSLVIIVYLNNS